MVENDDEGNIDIEDLSTKIEKHRDNVAAFMVTYPSTFGVFEEKIVEICGMVHEAGGQVYMDGANMNAQVGLTSPGVSFFAVPIIKVSPPSRNLHAPLNL